MFHLEPLSTANDATGPWHALRECDNIDPLLAGLKQQYPSDGDTIAAETGRRRWYGDWPRF
jgi:hypothetical protein